ncbi:hypothetical protein [Corallincola spongiicola]|uniref:Uncharacterized protein n=1 Tax=Corallincola spongiicola TaxID=2520508 RepID=A0ABY1WLC5_9GAMM|nr:hypothetical protein [Corallincola spongiicola]TAA41709.1 hypothetical protein EXY25_15820 [Corallincola spongiicola]
MSSTFDFYQSEEFRNELRVCRLFRLKYPRGGHYNDGFELLGEIKFANGEELLKALDVIGVRYKIHSEKPQVWCPPPLAVGSETCWIEYENIVTCFGYKTYVKIGTCEPSLEFNFNSVSWYEVTLEDVKRAASFEKVLISYNLL